MVFSSLEQTIRDKSAVVGVIGLGYVGLPLIRAFVGSGFRTMGFDVDQGKIDRLLAGQSYIAHIPSPWIAECVANGSFRPTADMRCLAEADALLICVPTPLNESRDPDLAYIEATARQIAAVLRPGQLIVLESTTYPGTTRDVVLPILAARGLHVGRDYFLAFSPEREDPGNPSYTAQSIPKVVGGIDARQRPVGRTAVRPSGGAGGAGLQLRSRRGLQDPGEHLPLGEHRHGQRVENALRPPGNRHLGGDRRGQDQALRFPGLLSRPGSGRALHSHRPFLLDLVGAEARHGHPLYRAGG